MTVCPQCGEPAPEYGAFCPSCGAALRPRPEAFAPPADAGQAGSESVEPAAGEETILSAVDS